MIYMIYIYIKLSQRMLFTYHFFGSGLVLLGAARINVFASSETFFQSAGLKLKLPKRTWPEAPKVDKNGWIRCWMRIWKNYDEYGLIGLIMIQLLARWIILGNHLTMGYGSSIKIPIKNHG